MSVQKGGFTLIEALIALALSSMVVILVSTTFLVQSRYYGAQTRVASVHDNARMATERVAEEVRSVASGGFVVAGPRTLTVRSPMRVGVICQRSGGDIYLHLDGGLAGVDTNEFAGVALRDTTTGTWAYRNTLWSNVDRGSLGAAATCAAAGSDTTGASAEFRVIGNLQGLYGSVPNRGMLLMLFRETTYKVQTSVLEPSVLGLFRGTYGKALVEFASGLDSTARFQYRAGGTTYADTVTGASLANIDGVRVIAEARVSPETGGQNDVTFGWSVNIGLRNSP